MDANEAAMVPPKNPLTIQLNLAVLRYVVSSFFAKWLSAYEPLVTSDVRTAAHNESVGGVPNSAHLYGLAEDFQIRFKSGGAVLSQAQAKSLYDQVIRPNWPGFSEWESASGSEGYHIHVNLSREVSTYTGIASMAGLGVLGFVIINSWGNNS